MVKATPLGRWGGETKIAKAVRFLIETRFRHRRSDPGRWRAARQVAQVAEPIVTLATDGHGHTRTGYARAAGRLALGARICRRLLGPRRFKPSLRIREICVICG